MKKSYDVAVADMRRLNDFPKPPRTIEATIPYEASVGRGVGRKQDRYINTIVEESIRSR